MLLLTGDTNKQKQSIVKILKADRFTSNKTGHGLVTSLHFCSSLANRQKFCIFVFKILTFCLKFLCICRIQRHILTFGSVKTFFKEEELQRCKLIQFSGEVFVTAECVETQFFFYFFRTTTYDHRIFSYCTEKQWISLFFHTCHLYPPSIPLNVN